MERGAPGFHIPVPLRRPVPDHAGASRRRPRHITYCNASEMRRHRSGDGPANRTPALPHMRPAGGASCRGGHRPLPQLLAVHHRHLQPGERSPEHGGRGGEAADAGAHAHACCAGGRVACPARAEPAPRIDQGQPAHQLLHTPLMSAAAHPPTHPPPPPGRRTLPRRRPRPASSRRRPRPRCWRSEGAGAPARVRPATAFGCWRGLDTPWVCLLLHRCHLRATPPPCCRLLH